MTRNNGVAMVAVGVMLTGCASVIDYCDLGKPARCDLEYKLETQINSGLDSIGSDAKVNVTIDCPDGPNECGLPEFVRDEAGDWQVIEVRVDGR